MYEKIFVPVDNSEHSIASIDVAVRLAKQFGGELVASHAYAARMHDYRFKQMEFTLPEEYLVESAMEKQRKIHDSLITMGLELISDSYLVVAEERARKAGVPFTPRMYDGKNFKVIADDINNSGYDLVVMGALGLGAVRDSMIGSVTERVARRVKTDMLVMKNTAPVEVQFSLPRRGSKGGGEARHAASGGQEVRPAASGGQEARHAASGGQEVRHAASGGIVVGVDGSPESFAGLKTAIALGKAFGKQVEAISVYDPYLHYAMFNSIVHVLTEKASKVFKFKEQEQLHEEVIDTGLAKIYQSHLEVARRIATEEDYDLKITLLDGKAFEKIIQYVRREKPWLLVLGRIGVHSDEEMDIGSNTENLLRLVPCNVLLSSRRYTPPLDVQAEESMLWTEEATRILNTAPDFARGIAKTTVHRWAMERGHSVITLGVVEQAMATILPRSAMIAMGIVAEDVAKKEIEAKDAPTYICSNCGYVARGFEPAVCAVCGASPELFSKLDRKAIEGLTPLEGAIQEERTFDNIKLKWTEEARKIVAAVPDGYQRRRAKAQIEKKARVQRLDTITKDMVTAVVGDTLADTGHLQDRGELNQTALDVGEESVPAERLIRDGDFSWTAEAVARINRVPEGFMRKATKGRVESAAKARGEDVVTLEICEEGIAEGRRVMEEVIRKQNAERQKGR